MTTKQFEEWLREAINFTVEGLADADPDSDPHIRRVETFEEAGILTTDRGLVVTFRDGSEIQVTLVQSRRGRDSGDGEDNE